MSGSDPRGLITDLFEDSQGLDVVRRERGANRSVSSIASQRSPANLDAIALTDPRTGVLAVASHWAGRIRWHHRLLPEPRRSVTTELTLIAEHWDWAVGQPWGEKMVEELTSLRDALYHARHGVHLRRCPVCDEPVRVDRFVREHGACINEKVDP